MNSKGTKFFVSDQLTIADIKLFFELGDLEYIYYDVFFTLKNYPKLSEWYERCKEHKGIKEVHEEWEGRLLEIKNTLHFGYSVFT